MLKNVKLTNFGIHKKLNVTFEKGLNAIVGENTAGKTQIMESICYALFGKTQNSKLEKIINFDADKAISEINLNDTLVQRDRTKATSSLNKIKKIELENLLNINYKEFLSIFYISSHEQQNLFDASYLRNFLIELFNLNEYSTVYQRLNVELNTLTQINTEIAKVNKELLKKRYLRVKAYKTTQEKKIDKYHASLDKIRADVNSLFGSKGKIEQKFNEIQRKSNLLKAGKCSKCERDYSDIDVKQGLEKLSQANLLIKTKESKLLKVLAETKLKEVKYQRAVTSVDNKISRCIRVTTIIKEQANKKSELRNDKRIAEIQSVLAIFSPKAFPSHLLKAYIPVIINTANKLLKLIFDNTTVDIRTEKPESNRPDFKPFIKRGKEILEMKDLSGSERVLVNLCFRLGVISIFKQLCKTEIDFMLIDEGLERVDDDNSMRVLQMLKHFMKLNFLNQVILVTHKTILKDQKNINYIELRRDE